MQFFQKDTRNKRRYDYFKINQDKTSKIQLNQNQINQRIIIASFLFFLSVLGIGAAFTIGKNSDKIEEPVLSGSSAISKKITDKSITDNNSCNIENEDNENNRNRDAGSGGRIEKPSEYSSSQSYSKATAEEGENGKYTELSIEPVKSSNIISNTVSFFQKRIPFVRQSMESNGFYFLEKLLDPLTQTSAFVAAKDEKYAQNLNGYFYYLFDEKGSTDRISPFVLNISILFDEENRQSVVQSGTFAQTRHLAALENSLQAALGECYSREIYNFILVEYTRTFSDRVNGRALQNPVYKLQMEHVEVIFHNSFLTYVEFYIYGLEGAVKP